MAPKQRNGAKGSAYLRPTPLTSIAVRPTTDPPKDEKNNVSGIAGQPRNAPIIASSLMSPPPIPSTPVKLSYAHASASRNPPPANMPIRELRGEGTNSNGSPTR